MQIKNNKKFYIIFFISLFLFNVNLNAEEFNITAKEILLDKENEILVGKGAVQAIDSEGRPALNHQKIRTKAIEKVEIAELRTSLSLIEEITSLEDGISDYVKNYLIPDNHLR